MLRKGELNIYKQRVFEQDSFLQCVVHVQVCKSMLYLQCDHFPKTCLIEPITRLHKHLQHSCRVLIDSQAGDQQCLIEKNRGTQENSYHLPKDHHLILICSRKEEEAASSGLPSWFLELVPAVKYDVNNVCNWWKLLVPLVKDAQGCIVVDLTKQYSVVGGILKAEYSLIFR